jgi:carboxyl-terminal processing protease
MLAPATVRAVGEKAPAAHIHSGRAPAPAVRRKLMRVRHSLTAALSRAAGDAPDGAVPKADLALIKRVMARVEQDYVHPISSRQLTDKALKGMLSRLDPHSSYMTETEFHQIESEIDGEFGGIGIRMSETGAVPEVISPIDGTPAARAGLEPGDLIVAIDGQATNGMDLQKAVTLLRGDPGTSVTLTIARSGKAPFPVKLTRALIDVPTVTSKLEPGHIGFLRISEFDANTPPAVRSALERMKREAGGHLKGLVLDLRNDPGGLLDAAATIAGDFLNGGTIVSTRGRLGEDDQVYTAPPHGDLIPGTPMLVLINSGSASASEIVAGALHDRKRAAVMGTRSFGKGSVQSVLPLPGDGALRLTTALYYTPSGRSIQGVGITPDIYLPAPRHEQVANIVVTRERNLHGSFAPIDRKGKPVKPLYSRPIKPKLIGTARDGQLKAALAYFRSDVASSQAAK